MLTVCGILVLRFTVVVLLGVVPVVGSVLEVSVNAESMAIAGV